jgi:hypothetical protein
VVHCRVHKRALRRPDQRGGYVYAEEMLATPMQLRVENHPLLAVRDSIFAAALHTGIWKPEDAPCRPTE